MIFLNKDTAKSIAVGLLKEEIEFALMMMKSMPEEYDTFYGVAGVIDGLNYSVEDKLDVIMKMFTEMVKVEIGKLQLNVKDVSIGRDGFKNATVEIDDRREIV